MQGLERITHNPKVLGGQACIRGMRVMVAMIVSEIAAGTTKERLLQGFPYLEAEDIEQAVRFAAFLATEREVVVQ
jgi:uncharacterized protein (DUF433 family)